MELNPAEYVGLTAGVLTTAAYVPQVYKTWRSKSAGDISLVMYLSMTLGLFLWLVYGVLLRAPSVIIANGVSLALAAWMLRMKMRHIAAARAERVVERARRAAGRPAKPASAAKPEGGESAKP